MMINQVAVLESIGTRECLIIQRQRKHHGNLFFLYLSRKPRPFKTPYLTPTFFIFSLSLFRKADKKNPTKHKRRDGKKKKQKEKKKAKKKIIIKKKN